MHLSILILILAAGTAPLANAWTLSGVGFCGMQLNALDLSVALSKVIMDSAVGKGLCGKSVNISVPHYSPAQHIQATIVDTCLECAEGDMNVGETVYRMLAGSTGLSGEKAEGLEWCFE